MSLEQLSRVGLVGTERAALTADTDPRLAALLQPPTADAPSELLRRAAVYGLLERVARRPAAAPSSPMPACAPEQLPVLGARCLTQLDLVLARGDVELLAECLRMVEQAGRRLPRGRIPELLADYPAPALRARILAVAGSCGAWLGQLDPHWAGAPAESSSSFELATPEARLALIRAERQRDPDAALVRLQSIWAEEAPTQRAALLGTLELQLSMRDEAFLEQALDDRRKEVRQTALRLLRRLPESRLVQRAIAAVDPLLRLERSFLRRARLEVVLPAAHLPAWTRDGVDAKPTANSGLGERAYWLRELLSSVPPQYWQQRFELDAASLLRLCEGHDHGSLLRDAFLRAGIASGDADWLREALAARYASDVAWSEALHAALARHPQAPALVLTEIRRMPDLDHSGTLAALPRPWDADTARAAIDWMRRRWNEVAPKGREYLLQSTLRIAASALPPSFVLDESSWYQGESRCPRALAELLEVQSLRRNFFQTLTQPLESP